MVRHFYDLSHICNRILILMDLMHSYHIHSLLNSYIAYLSGRTYVFPPLLWDPFTTAPYSPINTSSTHLSSSYTYRASRIPLTAYISGPTSGSSWPEGVTAPRAVSEAWWDKMCAQEDRLHINTTMVNTKIGVDFERDEGSEIVSKWAEYLKRLDARCVNIQWGNERIIDFLYVVVVRLTCWNANLGSVS